MIATHQKGSFSSLALAIALMVLSIATVGIVLLSFSDETGSEVSRVSWCFFGSCKTPSKTAVKRWKKEATRTKTKQPCFLGGGCKEPPSRRIRTWKRQQQRKATKQQEQRDQKKRKWGIETPRQDKEKLRQEFNSLTSTQRAELHRRLLLRRIQHRARMIKRKVNVVALGHNATKVFGPGPPKVSRRKTVKEIAAQLRLFPKTKEIIAAILGKLSEAEKAKVDASKLMKQSKQLTKAANTARRQALVFAKKIKTVLRKAKADEKAEKLQSQHVQYLAARAADYTHKYQKLKVALKLREPRIEYVQVAQEPTRNHMEYHEDLTTPLEADQSMQGSSLSGTGNV